MIKIGQEDNDQNDQGHGNLSGRDKELVATSSVVIKILKNLGKEKKKERNDQNRTRRQLSK